MHVASHVNPTISLSVFCIECFLNVLDFEWNWKINHNCVSLYLAKKSWRSVKSFYGNKISYHRFMQPVIDEIVPDDENSSADIILIGPPAGGYETDNEEGDKDVVAETGLPNKVSSEMVVIHNNWSDNEEENNSNQARSSGSQSKRLIDHGEVDDSSSGISDEEAPFENGRRKQTAKEKDDPQTKKKQTSTTTSSKSNKGNKGKKKSNSEVD